MAKTIIIGGGAIGLSTAYHLAACAAEEVTLFERDRLTSGTSWHAAGIVGPLRATMNMTRLAMAALEVFPALERETGLSTGFVRTGGYWLARRPERMDELERIAALGQHMGIDARVLGADGLAIPALSHTDPQGLVGALQVTADAAVNPVDLCMAYARGAAGRGCEIREESPVAQILIGEGRVRGVRLASGEDISADRIVVCAGAWSRLLTDPLGVALPLQPVEHMYVVSEPVAGLPVPCPVLRDLDRGIYVKGDAGRLVIGGFEADAKPWDPAGPEGDRSFLELDEDWEQFAPFMEAALALVPALVETGIQRFMNGPESFTADTRPLIGEAPQLDGLFIAAGMNSVGVMSSAGIGRALAAWVGDGAPPFDLWEVDVARADPLAARPSHMRARMAEAVADVFALHWPFKQPKAGRDLRRSALHDRWAAEGAVFGVTASWERPLWFARTPEERDLPYSVGPQPWFPFAAREAREMAAGASLIELSPFTKIVVEGPDALSALQALSPSDLDLATGRARYTALLNESGGIEMDLTITRETETRFRLISGAATRWRDLAWLRRRLGTRRVELRDETELSSLIGVMGPESRALLTNVSDEDWADFPFATARQCSVAGIPVTATRLSYVGELGWELTVPPGEAGRLFDALRSAGAGLMGHYALEGCRVEKGFRHWGHDIGPEVSPLEAGLGFIVDWEKPDFAGKAALERQRDSGPRAPALRPEGEQDARMSKVQAIIIGGGAMGVSLLYHLSKAGWSDVLLLEKNDLTHGSTWHAAGLCTHFAHNPTIQELRARSVRLYRDILPEETGQSTGFHACGAMRVTRSRDRMDEFAHVAGLSAFTGYPLRLIGPDEIHDLHPLARTDGLIGGIYEPEDGHVDPTLATTAMAAVARARGAEIHRNTPVSAVRRVGADWAVETPAGTFRAPHLVNAAGTWGWEIGQMMGVEVPSVPILHQYLVTDRVDAVAQHQSETGRELPIIRDPEESWYLRQERDGLILGPYEREAQPWSVDGVPPDFGAELLPPDLDRVEHIIEAAMARVPALATAGIKSVVNGPITFSPDANPLIGPVHGLCGAWLLTGSSMGVMEGGGAGWFLAHWMTHGAPPMDALAVDPRRFGAWADRSYRLEKAIECFGLQFGVHYPYEERSAGRGRRLSPLHDRLAERGAVFGAVHGWERPNWFADAPGIVSEPRFRRQDWFEPVAREVACATERVALSDLSIFSKFRVSGPDTERLLDRLGANRPPRPGRIALTHALTPAGGIAAEFGVARLGKNAAYLTSAAAAEEMDHDLLTDLASGLNVAVENLTEARAAIGVMGPNARDLLNRLTEADLGDAAFPWLSAREMILCERRVTALRVSYVGELGWELHGPAADVPPIFDALMETGRALGVGLVGAHAINSMRLEKGYRAWGADLTTERSPLEAGLGAFVRLEGRDFPGRDALLARAKRDDQWEMVLLAVESGEADPFHAHVVRHAGAPVGIVTSGGWGHRVGMALALAYLRQPGLRGGLEVEILGERRPARVLDAPPFDPENRRPRGG